MVPGAVLAAGQSSRMGRSKALLRTSAAHAETFLDRVIASMREGGIHDVLVIGRPEDAPLIDAVSRQPVATRFVPNERHALGQLSSMLAAVAAVDHPGVRGLLVMPVDMPLVRPATFEAVLREFAAHPSSIVRAAHGGRHGHPVIFDRASFDALRHADPSSGAKAVLRAHADRVRNVDVPDEGVLKDFDTAREYAEEFGKNV
jgi:CTP:molybdopterin cytidylyltransferase MocA